MNSTRNHSKTAPLAAVFFTAVILAIISIPAGAFWLMDGKALCTDPATQTLKQCVTDGSGGMIAVWLDQRISENNVCAQWIDSTGAIRWEEDGIIIWDIPSNQLNPSITAAEPGKAIVVWQDDLYNTDSYPDTTMVIAAKLGGGFGGRIFVCGSTRVQTSPVIATDEADGAVIAWVDERAGSDMKDIYAQRLSSDGTKLWNPDGIPVCTLTGTQYNPIIVSDGSGGAIIAWSDSRNGNWDIYAQHLDSLGAELWTAGGISVCSDPDQQLYAQIASDGYGGAMIVWTDYRGVSSDIYIQRIRSYGTADWTVDGIPVCSASGTQTSPCICADGEKGAVIAWFDTRNSTFYGDIYAQRMDEKGNAVWIFNGIPVCADSASQGNPYIATAEGGGAFVSWTDERGEGNDVYVQKLTGAGTPAWETDGIALSTTDDNNVAGNPVADGSGGVIVGFSDERAGNRDIYAGRIFADGTMGWEPSFASATDLPDDEGGWVRVSVDAPSHDNAGVDYYQVIGYNIWRRVDLAASAFESASEDMTRRGGILPELAAHPQGTAGACESPSFTLFDEASNPGDILQAPAAVDYGFPEGDWESIGYSAARQIPAYYFAVPTRSDSTSGGIPWEHFVVSIHTTDPAYYFIVGPDSGYSVDNLAPDQPLGLEGVAIAGPPGVELTWYPNSEADLSHYSVWRGPTENFIPARYNHLGITAAPSFTDEYDIWYESWYKIGAVDRHGNLSVLAVIGPDGMVTGDDIPEIPDAFTLHQNVPNPFNPVTTIRFDLPEAARVRLCIYNAKGELVSTLADTRMEAGRKEICWDGRNSQGFMSGSGIYFYRLTAGSFTGTRKMVLLK